MERLNNGEKFDNSWKENSIFFQFNNYEGYRFGRIKVSGFLFCFNNHFKKYLVKILHGDWIEVFAPNKTFLGNSHLALVISLK